MTVKKRWLNSVIATASEPQPALPWARRKAASQPQPKHESAPEPRSLATAQP